MALSSTRRRYCTAWCHVTRIYAGFLVLFFHRLACLIVCVSVSGIEISHHSVVLRAFCFSAHHSTALTALYPPDYVHTRTHSRHLTSPHFTPHTHTRIFHSQCTAFDLLDVLRIEGAAADRLTALGLPGTRFVLFSNAPTKNMAEYRKSQSYFHANKCSNAQANPLIAKVFQIIIAFSTRANNLFGSCISDMITI